MNKELFRLINKFAQETVSLIEEKVKEPAKSPILESKKPEFTPIAKKDFQTTPVKSNTVTNIYNLTKKLINDISALNTEDDYNVLANTKVYVEYFKPASNPITQINRTSIYGLGILVLKCKYRLETNSAPQAAINSANQLYSLIQQIL